jgi:hypothetical protein
MRSLKSGCTILILCAISTLSRADVTGGVHGVVKDTTGTPVAGLEITAINNGTAAAFHGKSDQVGDYTFDELPVGKYELKVEANGFKKFLAEGLLVRVNETLRLDIVLEVGSVQQTVTVSGAAETVDTQSITLKTVVDQQRIEDLPLNGRNPTQLMQLVAGVQPDQLNANVTSQATYPGVMPVSVDGGRDNTTNYILDGAENNDHYSNAPNPMPNPDALQEFSVQTNTFSAEFGRNVGGIVNAVTRSGTNTLHGAAFEYIRNYALNAANFFAPLTPNGSKQLDGLKRNQFGATLGGPVWLPKMYDGRDRTFFFFSYQGTRTLQTPSTVEQQVLTVPERSGDFSDLGSPIIDPNTGTPYPNNVIPSTDLSPVALALLKTGIPVPAAGQNTISYTYPNNLNDDQYLVRLDQHISDSNRFMARYFTSHATQPGYLAPGDYFSSVAGSLWRNTTVVGSDTQTFSASLVNTALFSFNRTSNTNSPSYPTSWTSFGVDMYVLPTTPEIYVCADGYFCIETGNPTTFFRQEYQFQDTVRWAKGKHQISFGGEYGRGLGDDNDTYEANGFFDFNSAAPFTGNALADFMIGKFNSFTQAGVQYKNTRFNIFDLFGDDSIRVTPRLTIDVGVRWDPFFPYTDLRGRLSTYVPGTQSTRFVNAPPGLLFPGDPGEPPGGYNRVWNNVGPRVGVAWDVFGDGRTALRGGYGLYFDRPNTISTNNGASQQPFAPAVTINGNGQNSFAEPYAGSTNPFPSSLVPSTSVPFLLPDVVPSAYTRSMRNAQLQSWNLTLERQLPEQFVLRIAYAGSKGMHLVNLLEGNAAVYAPGATTETTDQRRPLYPNYGSLTLNEPNATSNYNALQVNAERRFVKGLTILANYTFAKSIDTSSLNKETGQTVTDPTDINFDRGLSDFNHAHVFNLSGIWALPVKFNQRLAQTLVGGWQLSGLVTIRSGQPFDLYSNEDNSLSGIGLDRPDIVGKPFILGSRSKLARLREWLNPAAFAQNAPGTFGTVGRNAFVGPSFTSTDLSLSKNFQVNERFGVQFRAEAYNTFNHTNLYNPNGNLLSTTFLAINQAFDPRILQFALRLRW